MPAPRVRFCPKGHDKDAPHGSYWTTGYTAKGTVVSRRQCAICHAESELKAREKTKVSGKRALASMNGVCCQ